MLWLTPALVLVVGGLGAYLVLRRCPQRPAMTLDEEERRALEELLRGIGPTAEKPLLPCRSVGIMFISGLEKSASVSLPSMPRHR